MATVTERGPRLGVRPLCDALGVAPATYYRQRRPTPLGPRPRPTPPRALLPAEQQRVLYVETELEARGARLLLVETSGLPAFAAARTFYAKCGFAHEATVKNFFADGDHKLIFTKQISGNAA